MDLHCDEAMSIIDTDDGCGIDKAPLTAQTTPTLLKHNTTTEATTTCLQPVGTETVVSPSPTKPKSIARNNRRKDGVQLRDDGISLQQLLDELLHVRHPHLPVCTRVWARVVGFCDWPGVIWSLHLCPRSQWAELVSSYVPEKIMILFYGERTIMWVNQGRLYPIDNNQDNRIRNMNKWGEKNKQTSLVTAALDELNYSYDDTASELDRLHRPSAFYTPTTGSIHPEACVACHEFGVDVLCTECRKGWHTICLQPPVLNFKEGDTWNCPECETRNSVVIEVEDEDETTSKEENGESTGLTPDWIIHAAAYEVFLLERPGPDKNCIKCLLDPCTNDKMNPNIPAEKVYDKNDNGLKLSNSWAGYYVILNPDYKSQVQWRFVNRAIDEVENDRVPAVILICRNSTDTAYYQRLRPYPRVLLRRQCVKFKNYENTPIGFGIVVFCIAKRNWKDLYCRFLDAFSPFGEVNMPIDLKTLDDAEFLHLTQRVHEQAAMSYRDHWMQCSACKKWRIVPYEIFTEFKDKDWQCSDLKSNTTCLTLQRKVEVMGVTYASRVDKGYERTDGNSIEENSGVDMTEADPLTGNETKTEVEEFLMEVERECLSIKRDTNLIPQRQIQAPGEDLSEFACRIACRETLEKLANLPPRSNVKVMQALDITAYDNTRQTDLALSSLELARQASMAANRAYLKGLGEEPSAIHKGRVKALPAMNSLVLESANEIAKKARLAELELQHQKTQRQYEMLKRKQQIEINRLVKQLEEKKKEERDAKQAKEIALAAVKELEERVERLSNARWSN